MFIYIYIYICFYAFWDVLGWIFFLESRLESKWLRMLLNRHKQHKQHKQRKRHKRHKLHKQRPQLKRQLSKPKPKRLRQLLWFHCHPKWFHLLKCHRPHKCKECRWECQAKVYHFLAHQLLRLHHHQGNRCQVLTTWRPWSVLRLEVHLCRCPMLRQLQRWDSLVSLCKHLPRHKEIMTPCRKCLHVYRAMCKEPNKHCLPQALPQAQRLFPYPLSSIHPTSRLETLGLQMRSGNRCKSTWKLLQVGLK